MYTNDHVCIPNVLYAFTCSKNSMRRLPGTIHLLKTSKLRAPRRSHTSRLRLSADKLPIRADIVEKLPDQ